MEEKQHPDPIASLKAALLATRDRDDLSASTFEASHPPIELLEDYRDQWLPEEIVDELNEHLLGCLDCMNLLTELHLEDLDEPEPFAEEAMGVVEAIEVDAPEEASLAEPEIGEEEAVASPSFGLSSEGAGAGVDSWSFTSKWGGMLAAFAMLLGFGTWLVSTPWDPGLDPGRLKGGKNGVELARMLLLATPERGGTGVTLLKRGASLTSKDSLFFGFTPAKKGGFLYLFRIIPRAEEKPELLFPFAANQPISFSGGKLSNLERDGKPLQYPLAEEKGEVHFVLLQVSRPLTAAEIARLSQKTEGWTERVPALDSLRLPSPLFVDHFRIQVQK